jgi:hypothetical protein
MILLSRLIGEFVGDLRAHYGGRLLPGHERALTAMQACRTEHSPVLVVRCAACGQCETLPHSCGHRSCPHCQHHEGQQWLERQRAKLLPVDYYMVTFTLPRQLRPLAWQHQRLVYDLLLKLAWQTLSDFGLNDPRLKGKIGAHAVLHTHSRRLDFHPHVHFIIPAGALDTKHRLWRRKNGIYLFHEGNLAKVFRAKWFQALNDEGLKVRTTIPKDWVVDCEHVGRGDKALTYLGKYLYRGVLQEKDILQCENGEVTFRYTENTGKIKTRILPGAEFLWLLLQHVLPKGFRRTRDYGFLHSNSKPPIQLLQYLFHCVVHPPPEKLAKPPIPCKGCGGIMEIIATRIRQLPQPTPRLQPI